MTLFILSVVIVIFSTVILAAYLFMTRKFGYWSSRGVNELKPTPFFGNFTDCCFFRKSPGILFKGIYDQGNGLKYIGFYLFDKPALLIRDTELIKSVLVTDFGCFHDRYAASSERDILGNANLFLLKNPHWKIVRAKLTPVFTSGKLKNMFELMITVGKDLDAHLESLGLSDQDKIVDLKDLCTKYVTDVVASCSYGLRANSLNNPNAKFLKSGREMFDYKFWRAIEFSAIFFAPAIVGPLRFTFFSKTTEKFLRHALWDTMLKRMENGLRRNDLIDTLVDMKKEHEQTEIKDPNAYVFDGDILVSQATNFFTAGYETSSTTMTFAMYELSLQPHLQARLRSELASALEENNGELTYDTIMQLPYLDMVISETLRKYPALSFLDRVANSDYKVPGSNLIIEKGTPIYISVYGSHNDPKYFPDPESFDPERFNEENKRHRPSGVFLPFGDGPHNCIGMRFGLLQSKYGLLKIISNYELTACSKTMIPMRLNPKSIFTSADGILYVNFRKINAAVG